jgi:hypothetical protein
MDLESRGAVTLERIPDEIMAEVLARLTTIFAS